MLEFLILNGKFEAAKHFHQNSQNSLREELLHHFNKGNRTQFMDLFGMLHKQSKLQFYLRVYFLIYSIHPALRAKQSIPEPEKAAFRDFLDNRGSELAKTSEFLEFYALPFIKKPLQHLAFKNLFKKEWVANLKQKLQLFIIEEQRILKTEIAKVFEQATVSSSGLADARIWQQKVKQMQKVNKKLFEEVKQFTEKYHVLEDSHRLMMEGYQTHMMQSQSKWFQITKQLVGSSRSLIEMLVSSDADCLQDRRFLKLKKRIEKYQKFVAKKFDDLVSHSEDISIFDRPSISELSYSIAPHSQKALHTNTQLLNTIDEYVPTDFIRLKAFLKSCTNQQKTSVLNGLYWRILKSKSKEIRKLNIVGILHYDLLGIKTGEIQQILGSRSTMKPAVRVIQLISLDSQGKRIAFQGDLIKDFIGLVHQCEDPSCFEYLISVLGQISSEKSFKLQMINQNIIEVCVGIIRSGRYSNNETILENTAAIMLNMLQRGEGLKKYEHEKDIFEILKEVLSNNFKITRALVYGIIFALLQSEQLFKRAHAQKMPQFFSNILQVDPTINKTQLKYLKSKLTKFQPKEKEQDPSESDVELTQEEEDYDIEEQYIQELDEMMKAHDEILKNFILKGKQAQAQTHEVKELLAEYRITRVPKFHSPEENKKIQKVNSPNPKAQKVLTENQTPYLKQAKNNEEAYKSQRQSSKKINNFMQPEHEMHKQNQSNLQPKERPSRINAQKNEKQKVGQKQKQIGNENESRRMKKSVSADRGIGRNIENNKIYQSSRFNNSKVSEFKAGEEKNYRSPQAKKPREEVLRQINEQIKAEQMLREKRKNTEGARQNQSSSYVSDRNRKPDEQAFQSRPKLRRTPPRD